MLIKYICLAAARSHFESNARRIENPRIVKALENWFSEDLSELELQLNVQQANKTTPAIA